MADNALFAEFLVNKSKLKPLSSSTQNVQTFQFQTTKLPSVSNDNFQSKLPSVCTIQKLQEANQIFNDTLTSSTMAQKKPDLFLSFIQTELPVFFSKFDKYCHGKTE